MMWDRRAGEKEIHEAMVEVFHALVGVTAIDQSGYWAPMYYNTLDKIQVGSLCLCETLDTTICSLTSSGTPPRRVDKSALCPSIQFAAVKQILFAPTRSALQIDVQSVMNGPFIPYTWEMRSQICTRSR